MKLAKKMENTVLKDMPPFNNFLFIQESEGFGLTDRINKIKCIQAQEGEEEDFQTYIPAACYLIICAKIGSHQGRKVDTELTVYDPMHFKKKLLINSIQLTQLVVIKFKAETLLSGAAPGKVLVKVA